MNYARLTTAAVVAWVVDAIFGFLVWGTMMSGEWAKYPGVFRPQETMMANMPLMMAGSLVAMFALAYIYAKGYEGGSGVQEGLRFGVLLAVFGLGFVSVGIYGSFNIGRRIAVEAASISFIEMIMIGVILGAVYKPATTRAGIGV